MAVVKIFIILLATFERKNIDFKEYKMATNDANSWITHQKSYWVIQLLASLVAIL